MWHLSHPITLIAGVLLTAALISNVVMQRRSPGSSLAWILMIAFVPYLGVPLYFALGWRKVLRARTAGPLSALPTPGVSANPEEAAEKILLASGIVPPLSGNEVTYLTTGEQAYARIMQSISGAKRRLDVATFILGRDSVAGEILEALISKARSGVKVRLLLDGFGCFRVRRSWLRRLREAGGEVAFFMPLLHLPFRGYTNLRNHRKILVVDDEQAVVGGMNLSDDYIGPEPRAGRWRDLSLFVEGPIVELIQGIFRSDWEFATKNVVSPMEPVDVLAESVSSGRPGRVQLVASGPDVAGDILYDAFLTEVFSADQRIWITTPYFVPDDALAKGLELAAKRGVDVRICLPRHSNHRLADFARGRALRQIAAAGGRIFLFGQTMLHAKAVLVDSRCAIVSSANIDMRSLFLNYEIALFLYSKREVDELVRWSRDLMESSEEGLDPAGVGRELLEGIAGLISPLL